MESSIPSEYEPSNSSYTQNSGAWEGIPLLFSSLSLYAGIVQSSGNFSPPPSPPSNMLPLPTSTHRQEKCIGRFEFMRCVVECCCLSYQIVDVGKLNSSSECELEHLNKRWASKIQSIHVHYIVHLHSVCYTKWKPHVQLKMAKTIVVGIHGTTKHTRYGEREHFQLLQNMMFHLLKSKKTKEHISWTWAIRLHQRWISNSYLASLEKRHSSAESEQSTIPWNIKQYWNCICKPRTRNARRNSSSSIFISFRFQFLMQSNKFALVSLYFHSPRKECNPIQFPSTQK